MATQSAGYNPSLALPELRTAHVLFMDIVGSARLSTTEQAERVQMLQDVVRGTSEFRRINAWPGQMLCRPTGDGMALVFFHDALAPVRCALQIAMALRDHPQLKLRMGINSGAVSVLRDINELEDVAGEGIVLAQRVMDFGDAGHILLAGPVAEEAGRLTCWAQHLHDFGTLRAKHNVPIHVYNLCLPQAGNSAYPRKIREIWANAAETSVRKQRRWAEYDRHKPVRDALVLLVWIVCMTGMVFGAAYGMLPSLRRIVAETFQQTNPSEAGRHEFTASLLHTGKRNEGKNGGNEQRFDETLLEKKPDPVIGPSIDPISPGADGRNQPGANTLRHVHHRKGEIRPPRLLAVEKISEPNSEGGEAERDDHQFYRQLAIPADGLGERKVTIRYRDTQGNEGTVCEDELLGEKATYLVEFGYYGESVTLLVDYVGAKHFEVTFSPHKTYDTVTLGAKRSKKV